MHILLMPIAGNNKSSCMRWETEVKEAAENSFRYVSDFLRCLEEEEEDDHNQSTSDGRAGNIIIESSRIAHNAISEFRKLTDLLDDHDYQEEGASTGRSEGRSNYGGGKKKKNRIRAGPLPSSGHEGINPKEMLESASSNIQGHGLVMNVCRLVPDDSGIIMNTSSSSSSSSNKLSRPLPQAAACSSTWGAGGGGGFYSSTKMLACVEHHRIRSMLSNSKMKCGYMISSTTGSAAGGCNFLMRRLLKQTIRVPAVSDNETDIPVDDYSWRKYGQKPIKGSPHPRSYYRCTIAKGCPARKHVERCEKDPTVLLVTYKGEHDHVRLAGPYSTASVSRP